MCVLSCSVISLNKRAVSVPERMRTDGARTSSQLPSPRTKSRVCPPPYTHTVFPQTATLKSPCVIFIRLAAQSVRRMALNGSDSHPGREWQRWGGGGVVGCRICMHCMSCQTFLLHSDIYKVEEGPRAPAFPDSPNENRQSN